MTDLVEDPNKRQFQEFLQSIEARIRQLEDKRKDLNPKISAADCEN